MIAYIPVLVAIVGLLLYVLATNGKASGAGRLAYFAGLLVTCLSLAERTISLR